MRKLHLPLPAHIYKFDLLLAFVRRIAHPARLVVQDGALWRFTGGQLLSYRQAGGAIVVCGEGSRAEDAAFLKRKSRHCLGLCADLTAFFDFAQRDDRLWRVIEPVYGTPLFCTETVFEALVTLIIEQHITWKTAMRAQQTLMQIFHSGAQVGRATVYDFPQPRQLAGAKRADLKPLKITNRRVDMIIDIASAVSNGELDLESISALQPRTAYERLLTIKGVGHWTANNTLGRALGAYPTISQNDVALQAAVARYFHGGAPVKSAELVVDTLTEYGEFAGLAGHFTLLRWVLDRYPPISR